MQILLGLRNLKNKNENENYIKNQVFVKLFNRINQLTIGIVIRQFPDLTQYRVGQFRFNQFRFSRCTFEKIQSKKSNQANLFLLILGFCTFE